VVPAQRLQIACHKRHDLVAAAKLPAVRQSAAAPPDPVVSHLCPPFVQMWIML
jgi:hypothetical protein